MAEWEFAHKGFLWLLGLLPFILFWHVWRYWKRQPLMGYSTFSFIPKNKGWKTYLIHVPFALRLLALGLLIIAMARPQSSTSWQDIKTEGIDIIIAMDISGSMLARDFEPNRLEAAKNIGSAFIKNRSNDRIGLVVYSAEAFTQCPLTTDHERLINLFGELEHGLIQDGTAIGMGLTNAVNRLKESDAKSKVIILLTDGENNAGAIAPITAAEIAKTFGVRVYTIGIGSLGQAPFPQADVFGRIRYQMREVKIDEPLLEEIAAMTDGQYFRATDNESLTTIYNEIDQLEKTIIEETQFERKNEEYFTLTLIALGLLALEFVFRNLILNSSITHV